MTTTPKLSTLRTERSSPSSNVTLLPDSPRTQIMDPATDIDVTLPSVDSEFKIVNRSSNTITVKSSNGDTVLAIESGFVEVVSLGADPVAETDWLVKDTESEGTWNPTPVGNTNISSLGTVIDAEYYKKGRQVFFSFTLNSVQVSSASNVYSTIDCEIVPLYPMSDNAGPGSSSLGGVARLLGPSNQRVQVGAITTRSSSNNFQATILWVAGPTNIGTSSLSVVGSYRASK